MITARFGLGDVVDEGVAVWEIGKGVEKVLVVGLSG
jgi:hypothetical protein